MRLFDELACVVVKLGEVIIMSVQWRKVHTFGKTKLSQVASNRERFAEGWELVDVFYEGMRAVRESAAKHVPPAPGQGPLSYSLFLRRGYMPPAVWKTTTYFTGLVMLRDPIIEAPKMLDPVLKKMSVSGESAKKLIYRIVHETIKLGNIGARLKWSDKGKPFVKTYDVRMIEDIVVIEQDGEEEVVQVVLHEKEVFYDKKETRYDERLVKKTLVLEGHGTPEAVYKVKTQRGDKETTSTPEFNGKKLNYIPFVLINFEDKFGRFVQSPMEPIAEAQRAYLQTACAHRNSQNKVGTPMPVLAGFGKTETPRKEVEDELVAAALSEEDKDFFRLVEQASKESDNPSPFLIGSETLLRDPSPEANAYFMEVSAEGLADLREERKDLLLEMARFGARALAPHAANPETATEVRERGTGTLSVLGFAAQTVGKDVAQLLKWQAMLLMGKDAESKEVQGITVDLNTRYTSDKLDAQVMEKMMQLVDEGLIAKRTLYAWLKSHGTTRDGVNYDEEQGEVGSQGA